MADLKGMAKPITAAHIDERLGELPNLSVVAERDDARLVVSTAGIFVVVGDIGGVNGAAEGAYELARITRTSLADTIIPTPNVESIVVSRKAPRQSYDSLVIFLYQLPKLLEAGNNIDPNAIDRLVPLLAANGLAPGWHLKESGASRLIA